MPMTGSYAYKCPFYHGLRQTGLDLAVLGDVKIIIVKDEVAPQHAPENSGGSDGKNAADERRERFIFINRHKGGDYKARGGGFKRVKISHAGYSGHPPEKGWDRRKQATLTRSIPLGERGIKHQYFSWKG